MDRDHKPIFDDLVLLEQLQLMPFALFFYVDALENVIHQVSMSFIPVHMHMIL